ncbi:iron ascorbate-dependent oxidoreductase [Aureococcus anophagefferens]|nr:iron ascorbate-dependent oxidoreductase [Aureococcus anophagefferens]
MTRDASTGRVPVIDMRADDAGAHVGRATTGFFTVANHGADETISAGFAAGYEYMTKSAEHGTADRKESLQITAREGAMDGRWPATPATFEADARALLGASRAWPLILDLLETPLQFDSRWHAERRTRSGRRRPVLPAPAPLPAGGRRRGRRRDDVAAGPHTDWCCADPALPAPGNEGLECAGRIPARARPRLSGSA